MEPTTSTTTARDELAKVIITAYGEDADALCPCVQDLEVAGAIIAEGYRKPIVVGYVIVGRDGRVHTWVVYPTRELAQDAVDEENADLREAGLDWDYRVAEIVESP